MRGPRTLTFLLKEEMDTCVGDECWLAFCQLFFLAAVLERFMAFSTAESRAQFRSSPI